MSRLALGPIQPAIRWVSGARKWNNHWASSSAEMKNAWDMSPLVLYAFMVWCLAKHRNTDLFVYVSGLPLSFSVAGNAALRTVNITVQYKSSYTTLAWQVEKDFPGIYVAE